MTYIEKIVNVEDNSETFRDYSKAEIAEAQALTAEAEELATANELKKQQRLAAIEKLKTLGLSEEEIAALRV